MKCPECGGDCDRIEVDIGVGNQYGPWSCPCCGWSEPAPDYGFIDSAEGDSMNTFCEGCKEYGERLETAHDQLLTDHLQLKARCRELCALLEQRSPMTPTCRQVIAEARVLCTADKSEEVAP